ncbi:hypothetical protein ABT186_37990 [Streptomyces sp. NPDC001634]|uniref:hypothetical protein n=1 Tax=Streptomyces sp. NPDC001634 TaxID=3154390 RepID=UPI00332CBEC3
MKDQLSVRLKGAFPRGELSAFRERVGLTPRGRLSDDWDQEFGVRELRSKEQGGRVLLKLWRYDEDDWLVEADGPVPGPYSMSSFGLTGADVHDGTAFEPLDPAERTFYAELRPVSDIWDPQALAVSGLDRDRLDREGREPGQAMLASGSRELAATPVFIAYPLGYDWIWTYWYFVRFDTGGSLFAPSR